MKIKLLMNQAEFEKWKEEDIPLGDTAEQPIEFPCYALMTVQSWVYEEECAEYLYRADIEQMLAAMSE